MIVYKLTNGFASDVRHEDADYVLQPSEIKYADGFGELPPLESLHDPEAVQAEEDDKEAERLRLAAIRNDAQVQELFTLLQTVTLAQINSYVDNNVTDLPSARALFKKIIALLALIARQFNGGAQ